jgi:hypothetical protein
MWNRPGIMAGFCIRGVKVRVLPPVLNYYLAVDA